MSKRRLEVDEEPSGLIGRNGDLETNAPDRKPHPGWTACPPTERFTEKPLSFMKRGLVGSRSRWFRRSSQSPWSGPAEPRPSWRSLVNSAVVCNDPNHPVPVSRYKCRERVCPALWSNLPLKTSLPPLYQINPLTTSKQNVPTTNLGSKSNRLTLHLQTTQWHVLNNYYLPVVSAHPA